MQSTAAPGVKAEEEGPGSAALPLLREGQHVWVQHGRAQHAATIDALPPRHRPSRVTHGRAQHTATIASLPPRHRPSKAGEGGFATIRWASNGAREEVDIEDIVPMHQEGAKRARKRGRPYSPKVGCDSQWGLGAESKKEEGDGKGRESKVAKEVDIFSVGDRVKAKFHGRGKRWYHGTIAQVLLDGRYGIRYDDGDRDKSLSPGSIRLLDPEEDCRKPSRHSTDGEVDTPPTKRRVKRRDETAAAVPECQSDHFSFPHLEYRQLCAYYMESVTREDDELPSGITLRKRTVLPSLIRSKNSAFRRKLHQRILCLERRGERKEVHRILKALYDHDMDCIGVGDGPRALMDEILPGRSGDISLSDDSLDEPSDDEADSSIHSDSEGHRSNASNVPEHSDDDALLRGTGIDDESATTLANGHEISPSSGAGSVKVRALAALEGSESDDSENEIHEGKASPASDVLSAEQTAKKLSSNETEKIECWKYGDSGSYPSEGGDSVGEAKKSDAPMDDTEEPAAEGKRNSSVVMEEKESGILTSPNSGRKRKKEQRDEAKERNAQATIARLEEEKKARLSNGIDDVSASFIANGHETSSSSGAGSVKARALAALDSSDSDDSASEAHEGNASPPSDAPSAEQAESQNQSATCSLTCAVSPEDVTEEEKVEDAGHSPANASDTMSSETETENQQLRAAAGAVSNTRPSDDGVRVSGERRHSISIGSTSSGSNTKQTCEAASTRATLIKSSVHTIERVVAVLMKPSKDATLGLDIGVTKESKGRVSVICVEPDSPFVGTKLKAGMLLESINGKSFEGLGFEECLTLLKEAEGLTTISAVAETQREKPFWFPELL